VVKIPVPEWTKQILAPVDKAEASVSVSEPEPVEHVPEELREERETDVPEDVQEEVRALAAAEAQALEIPPEEPAKESEEVYPEGEFEAEEEVLETEAEAEAEAPVEPPEEPPKPPRPPRRFEFAFQAGPLRTFLAQVAHLVDEAKIVASKDGWHVKAVDPAHIAMIDARLTDLIDCFERRNGVLERIDGEVAFGVDVEKLLALVKKAKKDETIRLSADLPNPEDKDELTLEIGAMRRTMVAIDTADMSDPKVPVLNLRAKVEIAAETLLEAAKACEDITDHVRLTATREGLNVYGEGDVDTMSMDFRHGDEVQVETGDRYTSLFPLDYLMAFLKVVKDEKLVVQLDTDYPVRVDWDGVTKGTYLLAPRIESG
jgi:proliferating cell nuclear antigen